MALLADLAYLARLVLIDLGLAHSTQFPALIPEEIDVHSSLTPP